MRMGLHFSSAKGKTPSQLSLPGAVDWQSVPLEQKSTDSILPDSDGDELTGDNLMGFGGIRGSILFRRFWTRG